MLFRSPGSVSKKTLIIKNAGDALLTMTASVPVTSVYTLNKTSFVLSGGVSDSIIITFAPAAAQLYNDTVKIVHNAAGSPSIVALSGTGTAVLVPVISIPTALAFGSVAAGTSSAKNLAIGNSGNAPLTGTLSLPANQGYSLSSTSLSIAAGASQNFTVTFSPLAAQNYNSSITVAHNAAGSPSTVALSGTGQSTGSAATIAVAPASILITKNGTTGTLSSVSVNVSNNGQPTLSGSIAYSGTPLLQLTSGTVLSVAGSGSSLITLQQNSSQTLTAGTYNGTIMITHNAAGGSTLIPIEVRIVAIPQTIDITRSQTFPSPDNPMSYKLLSIPGAATHGAASVLPGEYKTDWRMYRDNGVSAAFTEYDGSSAFDFGAGKGFWALSKKAFIVSGTAPNVTTSTGAFSLNVQLNWNIIACPYERSIAWSDVVKLNALSANAVIYDWRNGAWVQASYMIPFTAYYYLNVANASVLLLPYDPAGSFYKDSHERDAAPYVSDRAIRLSLSSNGIEAASVYAGFDSTSCTDYDVNDYFAPPPAFASASIAIDNEAPHMPVQRLYIDHRKEVGDGQIFDLMLHNKTSGTALLQAQGMQSFPNDEVYLYNILSHASYDLKQLQTIPVPRSSEEMRFQLVIGSKAYLQKNGVPLRPAEYALSQNYPNPFNPSTTIRYAVPTASRVSVTIYNTLGQRVADLVSAEQAAGWHEAVWNARAASGVYFYRIEAVGLGTPNDRYTQVRKMMLLK